MINNEEAIYRLEEGFSEGRKYNLICEGMGPIFVPILL